jgi:hypothetical protein
VLLTLAAVLGQLGNIESERIATAASGAAAKVPIQFDLIWETDFLIEFWTGGAFLLTPLFTTTLQLTTQPVNSRHTSGLIHATSIWLCNSHHSNPSSRPVPPDFLSSCALTGDTANGANVSPPPPVHACRQNGYRPRQP